MTYNERNCLLFRSGEKKILNFLAQTADKMLSLAELSQRDAKKVVNSMKDFERCLDYFKSVMLPMLPNS